MKKNRLKGMMSSATCEWATPQPLFDKLDAQYHFTLDPCATAENAKCEKFFTAEDDGLPQKWGGWCSAIHLMASLLASGYARHTKRVSAAQPWSCSSRRERTRSGSTITV